jgi:hypothetical protein
MRIGRSVQDSNRVCRRNGFNVSRDRVFDLPTLARSASEIFLQELFYAVAG